MAGRGRGRGMKKLTKPKEKKPKSKLAGEKKKSAKVGQDEDVIPVASGSGTRETTSASNVNSRSTEGAKKGAKSRVGSTKPSVSNVEDKHPKKRKLNRERSVSLTDLLGGPNPPAGLLPAVRLYHLKRYRAREAAKKGGTNKFSSIKFASATNKNSETIGQPFGSDSVIGDEHGVKETLDICQGLSKITLDDWFPFYDFQHNKINAPDPTPETVKKQECTAQCSIVSDDDDEWEETLVYVDLQDMPDASGLFSSLASSSASKDAGEDGLSHLEMKIFDMDSQLPIVQLGGRYLAGQWEDTVGTSLFFKKNNNEEAESPQPHSSSQPPLEASEKLKTIIPEPEIPYDPLFGDNNISEGRYDLIAKSFKVLKTRYFPVVHKVVKKGDVIEDKDLEMNVTDYQIPPLSMVREFMTKDFDYNAYIEKDTARRKKIRERWGPESEIEIEELTGDPEVVVKTEPVEYGDCDDEDDGDVIFYDPHELYESNNDNEPVPSTSKNF